MKKALSALVGAGILAGLGVAALFLYPRFKTIEKRPAQPPGTVAAVLPADMETAAQAIRETFGENSHATERLFSCRMSLCGADDPLFPDAFQLRASAQRAGDAALGDYGRLTAENKQNDFYLYEPTGDCTWASEYFYSGQPAAFRSGFIFHPEPEGIGTTRVEVLEYLATIRVGEKLAFNRHGLPVPGFYADIRFVASTTSDRLAVLTALRQALDERGARP